MRPNIDPKGKVAVIMGVAGALGTALVEKAACEGMSLALADKDEYALAAALKQARTKGVRAIAVPTDLTDRTDVEALALHTEAELGSPWLVFTGDANGDVGESWCGAVHGVQTFVPAMVKRDAGHVVISAGLQECAAAAPEIATHHAIVGLSQSLFRELDILRSQVGVTLIYASAGRTDLTGAAPSCRQLGATRSCESPAHFSETLALANDIFSAVRTKRFWLFARACQADVGRSSATPVRYREGMPADATLMGMSSRSGGPHAADRGATAALLHETHG